MKSWLWVALAGACWAQSGITSFAIGIVTSPTAEYRVTATAPVVRDAAFSAEESGSKIYRDAGGRTRLETGRFIEINDPVKGLFYLLDPATKTAYEVVYTPARAPEPDPLQPFNPIGARGSFLTASGPKQEIEPELLDKKDWNGIEIEGQRVSADGMSQEVWYVPSLRLPVLTITKHPAMPETRWELRNLRIGEPEATLFEPPADFRKVERPVLFAVEPPGNPR